MSHHQRVAVITDKGRSSDGLSQESIARHVKQRLSMTIGVSTWGERAKLHSSSKEDDPYDQSLDGYRILSGAVEREMPTAPIVATANEAKTSSTTGRCSAYSTHILHHHVKWEGGNQLRQRGMPSTMSPG
jgi:hypothetical protein